MTGESFHGKICWIVLEKEMNATEFWEWNIVSVHIFLFFIVVICDVKKFMLVKKRKKKYLFRSRQIHVYNI